MLNPRTLIDSSSCLITIVLAMLGFGFYPSLSAVAQLPKAQESNIIVVNSNHNDVSPPLRDMPIKWPPQAQSKEDEASEIPTIPYRQRDGADPVVQRLVRSFLPSVLSDPIRNFSGILFSGAAGAPRCEWCGGSDAVRSNGKGGLPGF